MSSASVTYNFTNGLIGDADQVDQNFSDLVSIINSHLVHKGETGLEAKSGAPGKKFQDGTFLVHVISGNPSGTSTLTFPVPFASATYTIVLTDSEAGTYIFKVGTKAAASVPITATKPDGSNFAATADLSVEWIAIGT
jgi:hypothetical protein